MIPQDYFDKVLEHFSGDRDKTFKWFSASNPSLNGFSPLDLIKLGRVSTVKKYIDNRLDGNWW